MAPYGDVWPYPGVWGVLRAWLAGRESKLDNLPSVTAFRPGLCHAGFAVLAEQDAAQAFGVQAVAVRGNKPAAAKFPASPMRRKVNVSGHFLGVELAGAGVQGLAGYDARGLHGEGSKKSRYHARNRLTRTVSHFA